MSDRATVAALQTALAGEHAAVYAYGVVGARISDANAAAAAAAYRVHRAARNRLARELRDRGVVPTPAHAGYVLPFGVPDDRSARRLAAHVEQGCAEAYGELAGSTGERAARRLGVTAMRECAVRAVRWGARPEPFPGLPGR